MSIEEGFKVVHKALFGENPEANPVGNCSRCNKPLIVCSMRGTAQPNHTFQFHIKGQEVGDNRQPLGILMGRAGLAFSWEAKLCDDCVDDLGNWLNGKYLK